MEAIAWPGKVRKGLREIITEIMLKAKVKSYLVSEGDKRGRDHLRGKGKKVGLMLVVWALAC